MHDARIDEEFQTWRVAFEHAQAGRLAKLTVIVNLLFIGLDFLSRPDIGLRLQCARVGLMEFSFVLGLLLWRAGRARASWVLNAFAMQAGVAWMTALATGPTDPYVAGLYMTMGVPALFVPIRRWLHTGVHLASMTTFLGVNLVLHGPDALPDILQQLFILVWFTVGCWTLIAASERQKRAELDARLQLQDALVEMETLDQQKSEFFQNVSHELRTPLSLVLGTLAQLAERMPDDPSVDIARRNGARLQLLIDQLLDMARFDAGRATLERAPTDVAALVRSTLAHFDPIALDRQLAHDLVPIDAEIQPRLLKKALFNLLSNAVKFTSSGGNVLVRLRRDGDAIVLTVEDDGPGIPEHQREHVFTRFRQADGSATRLHEGTGIGLALVREVAHAHGGTARVADGTSGACIHIRFPWVPPAGPVIPFDDSRDKLMTLAMSRRAQSPPTTRSNGNKPRILVAEDHEELRAWCLEVLSDYDTRGAPDGATALELAKTWTPDLIVSDVMMPHMSGLDLLRALRSDEDPALRGVPVVLVTARNDETTGLEALTAGADDFMHKPYRADELLMRVRNLVRRHQDSQALEAASRAKSAFLASMSHELRTPLSAILGYSQMLAEDADDDQSREDLHRIESAGSHLLSLVDDVLDMSKIAAGQMELATQPTAVHELLDELRPMFEVLAQKNNNALTVTTLPSTVRADPQRTRQIVLNLVSNAAKFTTDGSIEIGTAVDADATEIHVRDTGIGMDDEQLAQLFRPFVQVHRTDHHTYGGTGLGLALSREFATAMGGTLTVLSTPGRGTRFTLRLPRL